MHSFRIKSQKHNKNGFHWSPHWIEWHALTPGSGEATVNQPFHINAGSHWELPHTTGISTAQGFKLATFPAHKQPSWEQSEAKLSPLYCRGSSTAVMHKHNAFTPHTLILKGRTVNVCHANVETSKGMSASCTERLSRSRRGSTQLCWDIDYQHTSQPIHTHKARTNTPEGNKF